MSVSVIIPVYNGARWLAESINSALNQGDLVTDVFVVDDGSTDGSAALAQSHQDDRVRVVSKANGGAASARNVGLELARTPYIAFLDADDLWRPQKLTRQLRLFEQDESLGVVTSLMQNFWIAGLEKEAEINLNLRKPQPGVASTFVARRTVFEQCGQLDVEYRNRDIQEWIVRVKRHGWTHGLVEEVLVDRRIHDANDSRVRDPGEDELLGLASKLLAARRKKQDVAG